MLNHLIQKNFNITSDLRNRKQRMQNHNNLHTINRQHEIEKTFPKQEMQVMMLDIWSNWVWFSIMLCNYKIQKNDKDEMDLDESKGFMMTLKMGVLKEKISYRNKYE
ncbi:reticulocyte binding protein, putative, fragment [Plasmodium vinckei petteri]|uniref:Reticulocyte binding protein, putative n=2 Tax=Plasmodium vinckei petteri TaxID=138298 RepID=A0A6V7T0J2_PLAVN|nr:reticulocyte binding protein, putative, fragment [Plasmodium vinckei petteri]